MTGELLWVVLYVMLGYIFSDRVQYIAEILGNLAWAVPALDCCDILAGNYFVIPSGRWLPRQRRPRLAKGFITWFINAEAPGKRSRL